MCKIFVFSNMSKIKNVNKTINTVASHLSSYERDGFGYAIQGEKGVFGERTTTPRDFKSALDQEILDFSFLVKDYNRIGKKSKAVGAGIFHGRTSTNHKTLINTHPIIKRDWTLIHNGVVTNHGPDYDMITTNDTEHLVEHLSTGGVSAIESHLTGYYALAAFSPDNKLHILRDSIAQLYFAYSKSIDSYIIATTKVLIEDVCAELKIKHSKISAIQDNQYIVFNNNKIESVSSIKPRGKTYNESKYSSLSLGYDLDDSYSNNVTELSTSKSNTYLTDQEMFLDEVNNYADSSYCFLDYRQNTLTLTEFKALSDIEKLSCTVIRADGTVVCPDNYYTERLYMG